MWEIVWVLTMSYCEAPEGKAVCERTQQHFSFYNHMDCVLVRNKLTELYDLYDNVILYRDESKCKYRIVEGYGGRESKEDVIESAKSNQEFIDIVQSD